MLRGSRYYSFPMGINVSGFSVLLPFLLWVLMVRTSRYYSLCFFRALVSFLPFPSYCLTNLENFLSSFSVSAMTTVWEWRWTIFHIVYPFWTRIYTSEKIPFFLCPQIEWSGHIVFALSVCLSVCCQLYLRYNFWIARGRDFIFGMHTLLMTPFQMTSRSMTLTPVRTPGI